MSAVKAVPISTGGTGYTSPPTVAFSGGGGSGAAGTANLTSGAVSSVTITDPGSGYSSTPAVAFSGGAGSGAAASAELTKVTVSTTSGTDTLLGDTVTEDDDNTTVKMTDGSIVGRYQKSSVYRWSIS